jgi:hypothetical protein
LAESRNFPRQNVVHRTWFQLSFKEGLSDVQEAEARKRSTSSLNKALAELSVLIFMSFRAAARAFLSSKDTCFSRPDAGVGGHTTLERGLICVRIRKDTPLDERFVSSTDGGFERISRSTYEVKKERRDYDRDACTETAAPSQHRKHM